MRLCSPIEEISLYGLRRAEFLVSVPMLRFALGNLRH